MFMHGWACICLHTNMYTQILPWIRSVLETHDCRAAAWFAAHVEDVNVSCRGCVLGKSQRVFRECILNLSLPHSSGSCCRYIYMHIIYIHKCTEMSTHFVKNTFWGVCRCVERVFAAQKFQACIVENVFSDNVYWEVYIFHAMQRQEDFFFKHIIL